MPCVEFSLNAITDICRSSNISIDFDNSLIKFGNYTSKLLISPYVNSLTPAILFVPIDTVVSANTMKTIKCSVSKRVERASVTNALSSFKHYNFLMTFESIFDENTKKI